jgi:hypothetical protein
VVDDSLGALTGAKKPKKKPLAPAAWGLVCENGARPDPCLHNAVALVRLSGRVLVREVGKPPRPLEEADELACARWLQRSWNSRFSAGLAATALRDVALQQRVDVLVEHVRHVAWDGVPRVDAFCARYLGCEDTPYHRAVGRVLLLSMAARALRPGCKVHTVPIIEGKQGKLKSTIVQILGGPFFVELEGTFGTKEAAEQVEGAWVVEIGELEGLSRAETNAVKAFISRASDRFRRAYARAVTDVPRRSVMVGTTNGEEYFDDPTGARRFLPAVLVEADLPALRADRDQLVAEAVARVDAGEAWWLTDEAELAAQREATHDRRRQDPWEATLAPFLAIRPRVTVAEVLDHLRIETAHKAGHHQTRAAKVLKFSGYERRKFGNESGAPWAYVRVTTSAVPTVPIAGAKIPTATNSEKVNNSMAVPIVPIVPIRSGTLHAQAPKEVLGGHGNGGNDGNHAENEGWAMGTPESDGNAPPHAFSDLLDEES